MRKSLPSGLVVGVLFAAGLWMAGSAIAMGPPPFLPPGKGKLCQPIFGRACNKICPPAPPGCQIFECTVPCGCDYLCDQEEVITLPPVESEVQSPNGKKKLEANAGRTGF